MQVRINVRAPGSQVLTRSDYRQRALHLALALPLASARGVPNLVKYATVFLTQLASSPPYGQLETAAGACARLDEPPEAGRLGGELGREGAAAR